MFAVFVWFRSHAALNARFFSRGHTQRQTSCTDDRAASPARALLGSIAALRFSLAQNNRCPDCLSRHRSVRHLSVSQKELHLLRPVIPYLLKLVSALAREV